MQANSELIVRPKTETAGYVSVAVIVNPFQDRRPPATLVPAGGTLADIVEQLAPDPEIRGHLAAFLGGDYVPPHLWGSVTPKAGSSVFIKAVPQDPISLVALLAPVAGQFVAGSVFGLAVGTLGYALVAAGVTFAVLAVGQALFGPSRPDRAPEVAPAFSITGARNTARPFDAVPVIAGTHRHVPTYGAEPYTELVGDKQYLRLAMVWGYAPIQLEDVRIGSTPIGDFRNVEVIEDLDGTLENVGFYPGVVGEEALNIVLDTTFVERTCEIEGDELSIDLFAPAGIGTRDNKGRVVTVGVTFEFEYREAGSTSWTPFSLGTSSVRRATEYYDPEVGDFVDAPLRWDGIPPEEVLIQSYTADEIAAANALTGNINIREIRAWATVPLRFQYRVTGLPKGLYEVRVRRANAPLGFAGWREQVNWTALRAIDTSTSPIAATGFAVSYYRLQATDQLNGVVDQLNGVASTLVPIWNGQSWGATLAQPLVDFDFATQTYRVDKRDVTFGDLFSFSRASEARFWGPTGTLERAGPDVPRFDYDKDGNARGLLLEDARRQTAPYSTGPQIDTLGTIIRTNVTGADSGVLGPDGARNWVNITSDAVNSSHVWQKVLTDTIVAGRVYTFSAIVERLGYRYIEIRAFTNALNGVRVLWDFDNPGVGSVVTLGTSTWLDSRMEEVAPGIFRIWITAVAGTPTPGSNFVFVIRDSNFNVFYTGDGVSGIRVFHIQVEDETSDDARGPSSPIYNDTASAVTRATDNLQYTPPADLSEEAYSVLVEASKEGETARAGFLSVNGSNATPFYTDRSRLLRSFGGSNVDYGNLAADPDPDDFFRAALSFDYAGGTGTTLISLAGADGTDTGATGEDFRFRTGANGIFDLGARVSTSTAQGTVRLKRLTFFNEALTQTELNNLTGGDEPAELGKTSNPAAFFRYVLTGAPNPRPVSIDNIDDAGLGAWFETCEAKGYKFDLPIVFRSPIRDLLQDVANAGHASPAYVDDKWTVIEEKPRTTIVQHFTPRNSRNFEAALIYPDIPQALRVRFANAEKDYQEDERIVYDDGFDETNTTLFEVIDLPGQVDPDNVYKLARHYLASVRLRPENFTLEVDIEHLVATRGDLCRLTHDAALIGQQAGRIAAVTSSTVTLDEPVSLVAGVEYTLRVRRADGTSVAFNFAAASTDTVSVISVSTTGTSIAVGDLFMFGQLGLETIEVLVRSIEYLDNLSARLSLVPYSPEIYNAADAIPPYETNLSDLQSVSFTGPPAPTILGVQTDENALVRTSSGALEPRILIDVAPRRGTGSRGSVTRTESLQARHRISGTNLAFTYSPVFPADMPQISIGNVLTGEAYDVQVRAIGPAGEVSGWTTRSSVIVLGAVAPPSAPDVFGVNTIGDYSYAEWTHVLPEVDVVGYEIRYHPDQGVTNWKTMVTLSDEIPAGTRSFVIPSRSGTYAIKSIDVLGNRSTTALYIDATLTDTNAFREFANAGTTTQEPTWSGTKTGTSVNGSSALQLTADTSGYFDESGTYEFGESDFGMVTSFRVVPQIKADVVDNLNQLEDWQRLSDVETLAGTSTGDEVKIYLEVAYSRQDVASSPTYGPWQRVSYGDYTARWVKFRLVLETTVDPVTGLSSLSPEVTNLTLALDLPRSESRGQDISSGASTYSVAFSPDFFQLESVSVTPQDMQTGDYYQISNKTRTGFDIDFFNSGGTNVDRTFDYVAIGYGQENGT